MTERRRFPFACALAAAAALAAGVGAAAPAAARSASGLTCATVAGASGPGSPSPGKPCWIDLAPYPFGSDGNPVDESSAHCKPNDSGVVPGCYLTVTSFAFRAWNRGLAATMDLNSASPNTTAFGIWLFNGTRWFPDPTFPGKRICKGNVVLWAGKRDYWLVGPGLQNTWPSLCRFDGSKFEWDPLAVPASALARVTPAGGSQPNPGSITTGACSAWNSCWFYGTYGTILQWDGKTLKDVSPDPTEGWLTPAFTASVVRASDAGDVFGLAVGGSSSSTLGPPSPAAPDGSPPAQAYTIGTTATSPIPFPIPSVPQPGDPYRTDVVAVDLDPLGNGWLAGDPAAMRRFDSPLPPPSVRKTPTTPEPAPIVPITALGPDPTCAGPAANAFEFTRVQTTQDAYLWASIGAVPAAGEAFAGGQFRPGLTGGTRPRNDDLQPEPSLEHVACGATPTLTRFRVPDPTEAPPGPLVPADRLGATTAVSASAVNDAWAATTRGLLVARDGTFVSQQPHVYLYTDGQAPLAPAGDDQEDRPPELQLDPPIIVFVPLPPPPVVVTTTTTTVTTTTATTTVVHLGSPIDRVKTRLHRLDLVVSFRVHRPVTLGLLALRRRAVVARTRLVAFRPGARRLVLHLNRRHWPTALRFVTDAPVVTLLDPGPTLRGTVTLTASAKAVAHRRIVSVVFQREEAGSGAWTTIGTATRSPFAVPFDTTTVQNGNYDFQAIATDSKGRVTVSTILRNRLVAN